MACLYNIVESGAKKDVLAFYLRKDEALLIRGALADEFKELIVTIRLDWSDPKKEDYEVLVEFPKGSKQYRNKTRAFALEVLTFTRGLMAGALIPVSDICRIPKPGEDKAHSCAYCRGDMPAGHGFRGFQGRWFCTKECEQNFKLVKVWSK